METKVDVEASGAPVRMRARSLSHHLPSELELGLDFVELPEVETASPSTSDSLGFGSSSSSSEGESSDDSRPALRSKRVVRA